jgi:integrase
MTGLRHGEALALTWSDVDLNSGTMQVRRTLQKINGEFFFGEPKSRRSGRVVTLPNGLHPGASTPPRGCCRPG